MYEIGLSFFAGIQAFFWFNFKDNRINFKEPSNGYRIDL